MPNTNALEINLENFLSSLFYLENEAKKEGYCELSYILKDAITRISEWVVQDEQKFNQNELGSDLYNALVLVTEIQKLDTSHLKLIFDTVLNIKNREAGNS
ncbi:MAG: hypothetical protein AAF621_01290 [Pseudomonadota bacterium]